MKHLNPTHVTNDAEVEVTPSQFDPNAIHKARMKADKARVSDEISHKDRMESRGGVKLADYKGTPLNVHISYQVKCPANQPDTCFDEWKMIYEKIGTYLRNKGFKVMTISTRMSDVATSSIEEHHHLTHVPEHLVEDFMAKAKGWRDGIVVERVTSDSSATSIWAVFDHMFRAANASSRQRCPGIKVETSGLITGPRVFRTRTLWARNWPKDFKESIKTK